MAPDRELTLLTLEVFLRVREARAVLIRRQTWVLPNAGTADAGTADAGTADGRLRTPGVADAGYRFGGRHAGAADPENCGTWW